MTSRPVNRFLESQRWLEGLMDAPQKAIGWSYQSGIDIGSRIT